MMEEITLTIKHSGNEYLIVDEATGVLFATCSTIEECYKTIASINFI